MTKRNLIIVIILLSVIDLVAAGWYVSRLIESSGKRIKTGIHGRRRILPGIEILRPVIRGDSVILMLFVVIAWFHTCTLSELCFDLLCNSL